MKTIENTWFKDDAVRLDGNRYVKCNFTDCQLIYAGEDETDFQDCTFMGCSWTFDDAALRTLSFLTTLYHSAGPVGGDLVEAIFASVRRARIELLELHDELRISATEAVDIKTVKAS